MASSPAGFTLVGDEQKVTQWVLACLSTTGLSMFAISIIQFKFCAWLRCQISGDWREVLKSFTVTVSDTHDLYFSTKVILL